MLDLLLFEPADELEPEEDPDELLLEEPLEDPLDDPLDEPLEDPLEELELLDDEELDCFLMANLDEV